VTDYKLTIFGLMILFVVYYLPEGLIGRITRSAGPADPGCPRHGATTRQPICAAEGPA